MTYKNIFLADIKWGFCEDDLKISQLPKEFKESKKLWKKRKFDEACEIVTPFLKCYFEPSGICNGNLNELFDIDVKQDIEAKQGSVEISSIDSTDRNLPAIRGTARFIIPSKKKLTREIIDDWVSKNDEEELAFGVCFKWDFPNIPDEFSLEMHDYSGIWFHFSESADDRFTTKELKPKMELFAKTHQEPLSSVIKYLCQHLDEQMLNISSKRKIKNVQRQSDRTHGNHD